MSGRLPDHPVPRPVTLQGWRDLTFLHWRYAPGTIAPLLPPGLEPDVLDGTAWVAATPFRMTGVRVPGLPALPGWSTFPELNLRTYVRAADGSDGLWFLSLDCPRRLVVAALRPLGLPYHRANGQAQSAGPTWSYRFVRETGRGSGVRADVGVTVGEPLGDHPGPLLEALTGRWGAYSRPAGRLVRTPVAHEPWRLHAARASCDLEGMFTSAGLPAPEAPAVAHFSPGVSARIGLPRAVRGARPG